MSSKHDSSLGQISLCYTGVLPIMVYTGGSDQKGYLFQASGIQKGKDFQINFEAL